LHFQLSSNLDYPLKPTLFLEFHGTHAGVEEQLPFNAGVTETGQESSNA